MFGHGAYKGMEPMTGKWGKCVCLAGCLALLVGCRTPQPNLKPEKSPEVLTIPPNDARYETSEYPKMAFDKADPTKVMSLDKAPGMGGPGGRGPGGSMMGMGGR